MRTLFRRAAAAFALCAAVSLTGATGCDDDETTEDQLSPDDGLRPVTPRIPPDIDIAVDVQRGVDEQVRRLRGVAGTAVGVDERGDAVILVYVTDPDVAGIPAEVDGVGLVVQVVDAE